MTAYLPWILACIAAVLIFRYEKIRNILIVFLVFFLVWYGIRTREAELSAAAPPFDYSSITVKEDTPYIVINDNIPYFTAEEMEKEMQEIYSPLDEEGRCGPAFAVIGRDLMPEKEREDLSGVRPSGWKGLRFDDLPLDGFLYHRCHLIAFELTGQNANEKNLITGTVFMNMNMTEYENLAASYIRRTGNHVVYRSTPVFADDEKLARGVLLEARSAEDDGVCFCVFFPNIQPGYEIDYETGNAKPK